MANQSNDNSSSVSTFKRAAPFAVVLLALSGLLAPATATPEKDTSWNKLIAEAVKHGGVETILDKTGSYVFGGPGGLTMTFTRRLDNKHRYVCAQYLSANINVCRNWDTEKVVYGTRANESAPWVVSDVPPAAPESAPGSALETPWWVDLINGILDEDDGTFHSWHHGGGGWHHGGGGHGFGGWSVSRRR